MSNLNHCRPSQVKQESASEPLEKAQVPSAEKMPEPDLKTAVQE